jgi:hypothetical protein
MGCATRRLKFKRLEFYVLRTTWIVFRNELRLLVKDRAALFMLAVAPLVIITVAGF